jgi:hypothetical protein
LLLLFFLPGLSRGDTLPTFNYQCFMFFWTCVWDINIKELPISLEFCGGAKWVELSWELSYYVDLCTTCAKQRKKSMILILSLSHSNGMARAGWLHRVEQKIKKSKDPLHGTRSTCLLLCVCVCVRSCVCGNF